MSEASVTQEGTLTRRITVGYETYRRVVIDPQRKVLECELAARSTSDPATLEMLGQVRRLWIGLELSELSDLALANEFAVVERVHVRLMRIVGRGAGTAMQESRLIDRAEIGT